MTNPLTLTIARDDLSVSKLREHVEVLAGSIGNRNVSDVSNLADAAAYIESALSLTGLEVTSQRYHAKQYPVRNIIAELPGVSAPNEIVVIGAHYDSAPNTPGANDNGTGMAALMILASMFAGRLPARTIRFVAFTCEEDPFFHTQWMGSYQYARACRLQGDHIRAMISLETIGYYSNVPGSQRNPWPINWCLPSVANFLLFVSNLRSQRLAGEAARTFRRNSLIPAERLSLPGCLHGVNASDQWSFWKHGYPAIMITDSTNLRYKHFHTPNDTPDQLCYETLVAVTAGLEAVIRALAF